MSRAKQERHRVIHSGSPLRNHSLNQRNLRGNREGLERLRNMAGIEIEAAPLTIDEENQLITEDLSTIQLHLAPEFRVSIMPDMIRIARTRTEEEENKLVPIPTRVYRTISDIQKIYKLARAKDLHLNIHENDGSFYVWNEKSPHPGIYNHNQLLKILGSLISWKVGEHTAAERHYAMMLKCLVLNLTSADFTKHGKDMIIERVKAYALSMHTLSLNGEAFADPKLKETRLDYVFSRFLDNLKKPLLK